MKVLPTCVTVGTGGGGGGLDAATLFLMMIGSGGGGGGGAFSCFMMMICRKGTDLIALLNDADRHPAIMAVSTDVDARS